MVRMTCSSRRWSCLRGLAACAIIVAGCADPCPEGHAFVDGDEEWGPLNLSAIDVAEFAVAFCPGEVGANISIYNVAEAVIQGAEDGSTLVVPYYDSALVNGQFGALTRVSDLAANGFTSVEDCQSSETGDPQCTGYVGGAMNLSNLQDELARVVVSESSVERAAVRFMSSTVTLTDVTFHRNKAKHWGAALGVWAQTDFTAYNLDLGSGEDDNEPAESELAIFDFPDGDESAYPELMAAYSFDEPVDIHCYGGTCEEI
jgi:hypothetical protein